MAFTSITLQLQLNRGTDGQIRQFTTEQIIFKNIRAHFVRIRIIYGKAHMIQISIYGYN